MKRILPILRPYDFIGSTKYHNDYDTIRPVYKTREDLCHISHVVGDTENWEQKVAQQLESMTGKVLCYVKNDHIGFTIPYVYEGTEHQYYPDFIVKMNDGGKEPLNLILECSGESKKEKEAKVSTAKDLWITAVNNHGGFGHWAFLEVKDPWNIENIIRNSVFLKKLCFIDHKAY